MHVSGLQRRLRRGIFLGCLVLAAGGTVFAQSDEPYLEEIVVTFQVRRLVATDMFVQYDGETIYLPLAQVFDLLDLYIEGSPDNRTFSGYIISKGNRFKIDVAEGVVHSEGRRFALEPSDYVLGTADLYLRVDCFETFFKLPMLFLFSELRVTLPLNEEFPAYQRLRRSLEHKRLKQEQKALGDVKNLPYRRAMLGGAVADWSFSANPVGEGAQYFNLSLGSMLAGGDLTFSGTGNSEAGIDPDQLSYRWHYFIDTASVVTQIEAGDIYTAGLGGPLSRRLRGIGATNKPQTQRKYFRTIQVEGHLDEGWEVELYVDHRLTDFVHTDQTGDYEFNVDVYYGASLLTLKMYGPNGELRTEERYIRVPYLLIPQGHLEYTLSAGQNSADTATGWYGQASAYYGLTDRLTAGVMTDVPISSAAADPAGFAGDLTWQAAGNLTLNASWAPEYQAGFDLNYNVPSLVNIDGSVVKYFENPHRNKIRQDRSVLFSLSAPLKYRTQRFNLRYYLAWNTYAGNEQINMHYGFNTSLARLNVYYLGKYQITRTQGRSMESLLSEVFSSIYISRWLRPQFRFTYDHTESEFSRVSLYLSRRVLRTGQLSFSVERDLRSETNVFRLTFNLFTDFADFTSRAAYSNNTATVNQVQRGSVRYDQEAGKLLFDRHYGVGRSAAVVRPFMDDNYNGVRDPEENLVPGLRARVPGGRERTRGDDRVYYYEGLNPYDEHLVRIDPVSLDDPLLKPTYEGYRVPLNPNMVTTINVPLVLTGEVDGMVTRRAEAGSVGQGGIKIQFLHLAKESVTEVMTFNNGEFFYLGLVPGKYRAYIDPAQLKRLGYRSEPEFIEFEMEAVEGGGLVSDLEFQLIPDSRD